MIAVCEAVPGALARVVKDVGLRRLLGGSPDWTGGCAPCAVPTMRSAVIWNTLCKSPFSGEGAKGAGTRQPGQPCRPGLPIHSAVYSGRWQEEQAGNAIRK